MYGKQCGGLETCAQIAGAELSRARQDYSAAFLLCGAIPKRFSPGVKDASVDRGGDYNHLPCRRYFPSCASTSGSTAVPSALTESNAVGSNPNAITIVGATWAVAVGAETVRAVKPG